MSAMHRHPSEPNDGHHDKEKKEKSPSLGMHGAHGGMLEDFRRRFIVSMVLTVPILILSPSIQSFFGISYAPYGLAEILLGLSTAVFVYGGYPFFTGFVREIRNRLPGMMTLIAVAITIAYAFSASVVLGLVSGEPFFWELATLIDIMLLGHWLEMRSVLGASHALEELVRIMPSSAHLVRDDTTTEVPVESLKVKDRVLVKPGEKMPVDGEVVEGTTSVTEAMLTGESSPVTKAPGDRIIAGAVNGEGAVIVEVKKTGKDTYLQQVIELVRRAQESKSRAQDLANRAAFLLTVIALVVGAVTFFAWFLNGSGLDFAVERAATVMVITCPHALGLAVPLVIAVSTALAARAGLLIRERRAFEQARDLQAVVFDKTGTLTLGRFGVTNVIAADNTSEDEVLSLAASLEARSEHPLAQGIVTRAKDKDVIIHPVDDFLAIPGRGIEGTVSGRRLQVVSPGYATERGIEVRDDRLDTVLKQGKTVVLILEGQQLLGALALADIIREESKEAVQALRQMGIRCMMLTGDNRYVAQWVADELGLDDYYAEVLPHEKSDKIKEIQKKYRVAMVGDGINDAPALVQADVGIAIGAGTDIAIESADVILVRNNPRNVVDVILLSRKTYAKMVQNLLWATGYNVLAIPLAAGVAIEYGIALTPAVGAALMSASTIIVAVNARLLSLP
ncbi:MAG: copper-translocating P-type ATPase [Methanomicrobiales archaeon]|nr:copper-translocating P-type ATPase [Methanomicrobiales archaeon]